MHEYNIAFIIVIILIFILSINFCYDSLMTSPGKNWSLSNQPKVIILWFYRDGCGHCDRMKPAWDAFAANLPDGVGAEKIDAAKYKEMARDFRVEGVPHIVKVVGDKRIIYSGDRSTADFIKFAGEIVPK